MSYEESLGFADAVGDTTIVDSKWGPSVGLFQIRSLREPEKWGPADKYRDADKLRNPALNAEAAFAISKGGKDWTPWSMYRNGRYKSRMGIDYDIRTGHKDADKWNL